MICMKVIYIYLIVSWRFQLHFRIQKPTRPHVTTGTPQPSASPTRSAVAWDRTTWWLWTGRFAIDSPMTGVNHKGKFTSLHYYKDIVYNKHIWYIIVTPYSDPMPFIPFISSLVGASNHIRLPITSEPPKYYPKGRWDWIPCDWSQKSESHW